MADETLSFIQIINEIREKLPAIQEASDLFDKDIVDRLDELSSIDLSLIISDLRRGNYLGNRKIDIDLSLNMIGVETTTDVDIAETIWTDETKTVSYDKAIVTFVDGVVVEVPFIIDGNSVQIATHTDLLIQLNNNADFLAKAEQTLWRGQQHDVVGEFVRFYDVIGQNSNIERITLNATSGAYKEQLSTYYWAKSTSAFQTLAMRSGDIIKIGNEIDNLILLANDIAQLLELQNRIPELVDTYTDGVANGDETLFNNLSKLTQLHGSLTEIITIYEDIKTDGTNYISTLAQDLNLNENSEIKKANLNKANIDAVVANEENINKAVENETDITTIADDLNLNENSEIKKVNASSTNISTIVQNIQAILDSPTHAQTATTKADEASQSATTATTKANEIKAIGGEQLSNSLLAGSPVSVSYDFLTGKFTFNIPQGLKGDRGESFEVNAVGTLENKSLYDEQQGNFSYLAIDVEVDGKTIPHIYFKLSDTSGDWSVGSPFGKGETGDTGISITSITFLSTTDDSGLQAKSGATDTYKILFDNGVQTTYPVYNGLDSAVLSVAGKSGDVTLEIADIIGLQTELSNIIALLGSDDTTLDEIQEIVNFIKQNKDTLDTLAVANIAGLQDALDGINDSLSGKLDTTDTTITKQGNTFNGDNQLLKLGVGKTLPTGLAINGVLKEDIYTLAPADEVGLITWRGGIQTLVLDRDTTLTATLGNNGESALFKITGGDTYAVVWGGITWLNGTAPTLAGTDFIVIWMEGDVVYGKYIGAL